MSDVINCSYIDQNDIYRENMCQGESTNCCLSGYQKICSMSACEAKSPETDLTSFVFWLILAGIIGFGIIVLTITYLVCKYRSPREDKTSTKEIPEDDSFEETICETNIQKIRRKTTKDSNEHESPSFFLQTEKRRSITTTKKTTIPVRSKDVHDRLKLVPRDFRSDSPPSWTQSSGLTPRYQQLNKGTVRVIQFGLLPDVG